MEEEKKTRGERRLGKKENINSVFGMEELHVKERKWKEKKITFLCLVKK